MQSTTWRWTTLLGLCLTVATSLSGGCDKEAYQSPQKQPDCVEGAEPTGCAEGQVCLGSRCYAQCLGDGDCARWERCTGGLCTSASTPQGDADIPDGDGDADGDADGDGDGDADGDADGDSDADADADGDGDADADSDGGACASCPDLCHGQSHTCAPECVEFSQCISNPVCDIARGECVVQSVGQCAPCHPVIGGCGAGISCVDRRETSTHWEVTCLTICSGGELCPVGTRCDGAYCVPTADVSCTAFYANVRRRTCAARTSCLPLGADPTGVECTTSGVCALACTDGSECPAGFSCSADSFCE